MDDHGGVHKLLPQFQDGEHCTKIDFFATDEARLLQRLDLVEVRDLLDAQVEGSARHRQMGPKGQKIWSP